MSKKEFKIYDQVHAVKMFKQKITQTCKICDENREINLGEDYVIECPACDENRMVEKKVQVAGYIGKGTIVAKYQDEVLTLYTLKGLGAFYRIDLFETKSEALAFVENHNANI